MGEVTGLTATRMLEIEGKSVVSARQDGDNLYLTTLGGDEFGPFNFRGATGAQGPKGDPGDVASGGYVGTLQDGVDEATAYADSLAAAGPLGLIKMEQYNATDPEFTGGDDSYFTSLGISLSHTFVTGRSYRIDFGCEIEFGVFSTLDNMILMDLMESGAIVRRVSMPGDTQSHRSGIAGSFMIKSNTWGAKTLTLRLQKRTGAPVTIKNSVSPTYLAVTDLGSAFV